MPYTATYSSIAPDRASLDALPGLSIVEFGVPWCPHCQAAQPLMEKVLANRADVRHIKVEDGKGQRLGRSYGIKLWPTLVVLRDGLPIAQLVRPTHEADLSGALG